jgi:hypothetical protein
MSVGRRASRLHDEYIGTANVFTDGEIEFAVGKPVRNRFAKVAGQMTADLVRKLRVRIAREYFYVAGYAHQALEFEISDLQFQILNRSEITNLKFQNKNGRLMKSSRRSDN